MPTRRGDWYYLQRTLPGIGRIYRTLDTKNKDLARRREDAVVTLYHQGMGEVVRAFDAGELSIQEIQEAFETGAVPELLTRLRTSDASLDEACHSALRDKAPDVQDSTLAGYETGLRRYCTYCNSEGLSTVREALTTDTLQAFKGWCTEEVGVSEETINNYLTAVSVLVSYSERKGWIEDRPEIKKFESAVRISYLESPELTAYFAELRSPFRPVMRLLIGTGMRLGEAEALTPSDLRLGNGEARAAINESKTSSGVRTVFVPPSAAKVLRAHIEAEDCDTTERIFTIPRRTVQKEHGRVRQRIGRPGYRIHDHRHTAAVHLARAGMPLHLLQQQLGHKNIDQTMRYARFHPDYGDVAEYFERVDDRLGLGNAARTPEAAEGVRA